MNSRTRLACLIALTVTLGGCSTPPAAAPTVAPTVSAECTAAIQALADVPPDDAEGENPAIIASTTACATVDEYMLAVQDNPESWFFTTPEAAADAKDNIIISACLVDRSTPMCSTAEVDAIFDANDGS